MKRTITHIALLAVLVAPLVMVLPAGATAVAPSWNVTGSYVIAMNYQGGVYPHDMVLAQDGSGNLTGNGGSPAGGPYAYTWVITAGSVVGNTMSFSADYTTSTDAVNPQTTMVASGTIATDGSMSGTWSDNYQGGARAGTWSTTSGSAVALGTLSAEDFGVVNYDTGLGILKGYTAGFGLTDATFAGVQSVVVQLFAGLTLLQTNTATSKVGVDITGAQISSCFRYGHLAG